MANKSTIIKVPRDWVLQSSKYEKDTGFLCMTYYNGTETKDVKINVMKNDAAERTFWVKYDESTGLAQELHRGKIDSSMHPASVEFKVEGKVSPKLWLIYWRKKDDTTGKFELGNARVYVIKEKKEEVIGDLLFWSLPPEWADAEMILCKCNVKQDGDYAWNCEREEITDEDMLGGSTFEFRLEDKIK